MCFVLFWGLPNSREEHITRVIVKPTRKTAVKLQKFMSQMQRGNTVQRWYTQMDLHSDAGSSAFGGVTLAKPPTDLYPHL